MTDLKTIFEELKKSFHREITEEGQEDQNKNNVELNMGLAIARFILNEELDKAFNKAKDGAVIMTEIKINHKSPLKYTLKQGKHGTIIKAIPIGGEKTGKG